MSQGHIQSWLEATEGYDDDEEIIPPIQSIRWNRLHEGKGWARFLDYAKTQLLTSSTKTRIEFITRGLSPLAAKGDLSADQGVDVFFLLTLTYPRYVDSSSRRAAEDTLKCLITPSGAKAKSHKLSENSVLSVVLGWLASESTQVGMRGRVSAAPANQFVLLNWACTVYTATVNQYDVTESTEEWKTLIRVLASTLDCLLDANACVKDAMRKGATVRTRRAVRGCAHMIPTLISTQLTIATSTHMPSTIVPLLGLTVDVALRFKAKRGSSFIPCKDYIQPLKNDILNFYISCVLMSKVSVPPHVSNALHDFFKVFVEQADLDSLLLSAIEKALLRSPENAMSVVSDFLLSCSVPLTIKDSSKLLNFILNGAKSSNATVRNQSSRLFSVLVAREEIDGSFLSLAVTDILALPKSNKTSGADHRIALYDMLRRLTPTSDTTPTIMSVLPALLAKETNDVAISLLTEALAPSITRSLRDNKELESSVIDTILREMSSSKPGLRRAFCVMAGSAVWELGHDHSSAARLFGTALYPAFATSLTTISTNPLNSAAGPLEGYVALAATLGPMSHLGIDNYDNVLSKNSVIQGVVGSATKPHFLLWQKCYQKLSTLEEELWLLRALEAAFSFFVSDVRKSAHLRTQFGSAFTYLASDSKNLETRRKTLSSIHSLSARFPIITNWVVRDALLLRLSFDEGVRNINSTGEEKENSTFLQRRFLAILAASASSPDKSDLASLESELVQNIVLAHHPAISGASRSTWIEICQRARVDPHDLISRRTDELMQLTWESLDVTKPSPLVNGGFQAITTMSFVAPATILPRLMEQLRRDLDPLELESIGAHECGIWKTPEGTLFVDVLANKKNTAVGKGKDSDLRKWEAELRKSLAANKAASAATLSKEDKALVENQLAKESKIRSAVAATKAKLERGLRLIRCIVEANPSEFHPMISTVTSLLISGAVKHGVPLVHSAAFETYMTIGDVCSGRLGIFRRWIGLSTLRSMGVHGIPDEFTSEPINQLILRVLYRLRTQAEQAPFDPATYSYAAPLISHVIRTGGSHAADPDEVLEQLSLALDFIRFHCDSFTDHLYPRQETIHILLHLIRTHPQLGQTSVSTLVNLGDAIHLSATHEDTRILIRGTLAQESLLRNACLQTLQTFDMTDIDWSPELWVACHDDDEQNARLARHLWEDNGLDVSESFLDDLLPLLDHEHSYVRTSCAAAFGEAAEAWPQLMASVLVALQRFYHEKAKILAPEFDEYGMVIAGTLDRTDPWTVRLAVAQTLQALAPLFPDEELLPFFQFLVSEEGLGDRQGDVRRGLLEAGTVVLDHHGKTKLSELIALFEKSLMVTSTSETGDHVKEAVVILFGRLARFLDASDPRIPKVVDGLVDTLKTPAETVQIAVSDCLAPLVKLIKSDVTQLVDKLFVDMLSAPKYAARRGAAYGLAGVIKGTGISGVKEFRIIWRLRSALDDKKHFEARQGAMFAFETLSATLERLFEPYVTQLLPYLLASFGDATSDVRDATQDAARVIMGNLSAYGVKILLPSLLSGLDEKQWRTKKGSIELLGTMAFCAPTQLALSLPTVIPRLTGVLTDSHAQVRGAANKSLKQFGEVISNPEIQSLVPVLLKALVDPDKGPAALNALLKKSFAHYVDSSSLALVIPIIERGLRERSSETKRKAARIVGNMSSLTDPKDFVPHLSRLLPLVRICLVDPVPEARATAAKALGTLVERLGEAHFPDLVPGLLKTLKTDTSGVDRQGAAQGLSEVLAGLGMERLEGLLPDIIINASSPRSHVKEGFMSLLVFLPATFGVRFQPHLPKIIQPILGGLADSEEVVREAALKAGRMIIVNYSHRAIDLLLPALEGGMFDSSWRIRQSSVTLVGELLFKLAGISGKAEIEEEETVDDVAAADISRRALVEILGQDRRDRVLASLYLARQDGVGTVRQSSLHVWKVLVQNTPRTIREILPSIMAQIISLFSHPGFEQQETAARTMGELCHKFGEKTFGEIIAILQSTSASNDDGTREGVCMALREILENTTEGQREGHEDELITMVRHSLVDKAANVRAAAARAFDTLQEALGARAVDDTIPTLLEALRQPGEASGTALQALREVMNVRAGVVFPILIPTLIARPVTAFNARALASLVTVAGNALSKRLTVILDALVPVTESEQDEELLSDVNEAIRALLASISDAEGLNTIMLLLLGWAKHQNPARRTSAMHLFETFCNETDLDISFYRVDWILRLVTSLDDRQQEVVEASWKALDVFVLSISKEDMESLVVPLRRTLESTGAPGRTVPGLSLPKGPAPIVPIILAGLTNGNHEQREQAAYAIGDLVEKTDEQVIKPFVVPLTGPLIRVSTQATTYPAPVKMAILVALTAMLERIPQFVKPFFPQLQRTFVKAAMDPTSFGVRSRAAVGLGALMGSQPRVDPLVTELITGANAHEQAIAASLILALAYVAKSASPNLGQASKAAAVELISGAFREVHDEHYIHAIATLFANLSPFPDLLRPVLDAHILGAAPNMLTSHIIKACIADAPQLFYQLSCVPSIVKIVNASLGDNPSISRPAREAKELLKTIPPYMDDNDVQSLL